jgi:KaiC/GvpD/RAD55 family RecA-like ATPase
MGPPKVGISVETHLAERLRPGAKGNCERRTADTHIRVVERVTALVALRAESREPIRELGFRSFSDLATLPPEPEWLWEGLLARGALTMLAGHPFVGKTMLVGGLLKALEAGSEFLGRETTMATAVLLTEEHEVTLRPRVEQLRLQELRSEIVSRGGGVFRVDWPTLIDQATEHALEAGHSLLVIDTFTGLAGLQAEEENDAGAITERLQPLQVAAGNDLAVLILHHLNKSGQPRGSSAFRGVTDTSIRMQREKEKKEFRLQIESRFSSPHSLKGKLVRIPDGLSYVGIGKDAVRGAGSSTRGTDERLLEALRNAFPDGLTYDEVGEIPGLSAHQAKKRFPDWHREGKIDRGESGAKGDPYRWFALAE